MNVFEAIRTRRSIGKVTGEAVSKELIERILEAGTWAPNHRRTEPWQFFVMRGKGRNKLAKALAEIARLEAGEVSAEQAAELLTKAEEKVKRAPVIIGVAVQPSDKPGVVELEEYAAVAAAIQNMLLEIHGLNLAAVWRTGEQAYHPVMSQTFGLGDKGKMLGFLYIGYPAVKELPEGKRTSFADKTVWVDQA
ncbi:nitroreductase [Paenibacillus yonginensis]|uniref:Putative NAD(P)H nitroreductase n=1 Tax=Paenibacillus yonginensis TaxID=1462996 RepID=A0A1B1N5R1_9BACL|nr:nitroreductase [Paenibacillus yonginensis]ANS76725.1 nitroreductase [Paenibacillus yonginensis]